MKRAARGFTLVEVLVAVAVIAIALGAGLRAAGVLVDNSQRLADIIAAQWCAENQLTQLKLTRQFHGWNPSTHCWKSTPLRVTRKPFSKPTRNSTCGYRNSPATAGWFR